MFLSYEYIKYLGYDSETNKHCYLHKIIDSKFEEEGTAMVETDAPAPLSLAAPVVAKCYQQRGYSHSQIAKQIFLFLRFISNKYGDSMNELVYLQKEHNIELWEEYDQEISKFLLFS